MEDEIKPYLLKEGRPATVKDDHSVQTLSWLSEFCIQTMGIRFVWEELEDLIGNPSSSNAELDQIYVIKQTKHFA